MNIPLGFLHGFCFSSERKSLPHHLPKANNQAKPPFLPSKHRKMCRNHQKSQTDALEHHPNKTKNHAKNLANSALPSTLWGTSHGIKGFVCAKGAAATTTPQSCPKSSARTTVTSWVSRIWATSQSLLPASCECCELSRRSLVPRSGAVGFGSSGSCYCTWS